MSNPESRTKPHLDAMESHIAEFGDQFAEYQKLGELAVLNGSFHDAARQLADEKNVELRDLIRKGAQPKDVLKCKAARNAALEDAENHQAINDEYRMAQKEVTLALQRSARAIRSHRISAISAAIEDVAAALVEELPSEFFTLFELYVEYASSGNSTVFNTDPTVKGVDEFAAREVAKLVSAHLVANRSPCLGSVSFLPDIPSGLSQFNASPIQIEMLARELAGGSK